MSDINYIYIYIEHLIVTVLLDKEQRENYYELHS